MAEVAFLDGADSGAKLNASDFGQVDTSTNRWIPKDIGSYNFGNTGYYLEFKVAPGTGNGAGTDTSGESNNFTSNGSWATTDQFTDYTFSKLSYFYLKNIGSATSTLTEGNLKYTNADNGGFPITMQPTSGKWYFEIELDTAGCDTTPVCLQQQDYLIQAYQLGRRLVRLYIFQIMPTVQFIMAVQL